jgi:metallo-beta-lactamase class B
MRKLFIGVIIFLLVARGIEWHMQKASAEYVKGESLITSDDGMVKLTKLNKNVWVHTTYTDIGGNLIPANGLLIQSSKGLILVDATWNNQLAEELLQLIHENFHQNISFAIVTHHKIDRIGGIDALVKEGIDVRSTPFIAEMAKKYGYTELNPVLDPKETDLHEGNIDIDIFYPGEAHTNDNVVVWLPKYDILFGDMIFAADQQNPGIIDEANIKEWPNTMKTLMDKYPEAETVIPGHKGWGDYQLLPHTWEVIDAYNKAHSVK